MHGGITTTGGAVLRATGKASIASPEAELGRLVGVKGSISEALEATTDDALRTFDDAPTDSLRPWDVAAHASSIGARELGEFLKAAGPRQARASADVALKRLQAAHDEFKAISVTDIGQPLNERQTTHLANGRTLLNKALGWVDDAESKSTYPVADDVLEVPHASRQAAASADDAIDDVADDAARTDGAASTIDGTRATAPAGKNARIGSQFVPVRQDLEPGMQKAYDDFALATQRITTLMWDKPRRSEISGLLYDATNALGAGKQALRRGYAPHDVVPGTNRTVDALVTDIDGDITALSHAAGVANPTGYFGQGLKNRAKALAASRMFSADTWVKDGRGAQVRFGTALEGTKTRLDDVARVLAGSADL